MMRLQALPVFALQRAELVASVAPVQSGVAPTAHQSEAVARAQVPTSAEAAAFALAAQKEAPASLGPALM